MSEPLGAVWSEPAIVSGENTIHDKENTRDVSRTNMYNDDWTAANARQAAVEDSFSIFTNPAAPDVANTFDGFDIPFWINNDQLPASWLEEWDQTL